MTIHHHFDAEQVQPDPTQRYDFRSPLEYPPQRVVSLVPSVTESLFDLNLGSRLVGVTEYCVHPAEGVAPLPKVGGTKTPDLQRIITLQPDLVIMNREENRQQDAAALEAAGVPVWITFPQSVQEALNLLWEILYVFDEPSAEVGERVRWIERQVDWLANIARHQQEVFPRVFVPIWYNPWMTFNAQTYIHDLLRICGGWNVFAGRERLYPLEADLGQTEPLAHDDPRRAGRDTRYPRITLEEIAAAQPEIILLPSEPFPFTEQHAAELAQLNIPAAHHRQIYLIDGSLVTWHGTRLAHALQEIPPLLVQTKEV